MNKIYLTLLFLVGLINFLPVIAVISLEKVNQLYGLNVSDDNLAILLRHRALLFGLVGGYILFSVFNPPHQIAAIVLAAISMLGFLCLFWSVGNYNTELLKVARVDIVGLVLLALAILFRFLAHNR